MIFDLPPPAIIHPEPSELRADDQMARLGLPRHMRRAIIAEFRRLTPSRIIKPTLEDLGRYGGVDAGKLAFIFAPGLRHKPVVAGGIVITHVANPTPNVTQTPTHTYTDADIGPDVAKIVIFVVGASVSINDATMASATLGGSAATANLVLNLGGGSKKNAVSVFSRAVAGGTAATIIFTPSSGNISASAPAVYYMTGRADTTHHNTAQAFDADPTVANLAIPANGGAVLIAISDALTSSTPVGLTNETLDVATGARTFASAFENFVAANPALSVGTDWASGAGNELMGAVSWAPA